MNVRRTIWKWVPFLLLLFLFPLISSADRQIRVGVYQNSPKVNMAANGQAEGIFIDILAAIAQEEGWVIEYVPGTWAEGLERLASGQIDLMPDVARTQDRESKYRFHKQVVLSDWFQVFTRPNSGIRSLLDLNGKSVALLERSIQQDAFDKALIGFDLNVTLLPFPEYSEAFSAVENNKADAVIANRFYGIKKYQILSS